MRRKVSPHACPWCKQTYDPCATGKAGACGCPPAKGMVGTYRVETDRGIVERKYGHERGNHGMEE